MVLCQINVWPFQKITCDFRTSSWAITRPVFHRNKRWSPRFNWRLGRKVFHLGRDPKIMGFCWGTTKTPFFSHPKTVQKSHWHRFFAGMSSEFGVRHFALDTLKTFSLELSKPTGIFQGRYPLKCPRKQLELQEIQAKLQLQEIREFLGFPRKKDPGQKQRWQQTLVR